MSMTKKRVSLLITVTCFLIITSLSIFAYSPIYCTGGDAGTDNPTHRYNVILTHKYTAYSHNVDRVLNGHVWKTVGHSGISCGTDDYEMSNCVGTIVGEAP